MRWEDREIALDASPLLAGAPGHVRVRDAGTGFPIVMLHGGWGYGPYPFDDAASHLVRRGFRCVAPDRTGYGKSSPTDSQRLGFHEEAATETVLVLDALRIEHAFLWGHSDGAVIAAKLALRHPRRFPKIVLESLHLWPAKPSSNAFFHAAAKDPWKTVGRMSEALANDHGERWPTVVRMNGDVWVRLHEAARPGVDLYDGRLPEVSSEVLFVHGSKDPRTEPGELEAAGSQVRGGRVFLTAGRHAPHAEPATATSVTDAVTAFFGEP